MIDAAVSSAGIPLGHHSPSPPLPSPAHESEEEDTVPLGLSSTWTPLSPMMVNILTPSSAPLAASPNFNSSLADVKRISMATEGYWLAIRAVVVSAF